MRPLLFAALAVIGFAVAVDSARPRLVGYGCQGASGALFADEESDFPICKRIESNDAR